MIAHINGRLVEKTPTYVIIDCGGVGYHINVSLNTSASLGDEESCKLFTELIVREDAQLLYGFKEIIEKRMFQLLISVSGVGPSTAMVALSSAKPAEIQQAILEGDVGFFKSVKGVGPKTAQKIIIDLNDKLKKENIAVDFSLTTSNTVKEEALSALISLGFVKNQAEKTISKILEKEGDLKVEEVIKRALKGS